MRPVRLLTLASLALALTTACGNGDSGRPATPAAPAAPPAASPPPVAVPPANPAPPQQVDVHPLPPARNWSEFLWPDPAERAVRTLPGAPRPTGSVESLGLRYMQALQRHDWIGAARLLGLYGRDRLSHTSPEFVERIGRNVLAHAGGSRLGPCRTAGRLTAVAAVVSCGRVKVVVHVEGLAAMRGVMISAEHPRGDVYRGPHTHAYTDILR